MQSKVNIRLKTAVGTLMMLTDVIDTRLSKLYRTIEELKDADGDPDQFGLFDDGEDLAGLGFIACQNFLHSMVPQGDRKGAAFKLGPRHRCGLAYAELVNAVANFVKHRDEGGGVYERTRLVLSTLGTLDGDYPVGSSLTRLADEVNPFDFIDGTGTFVDVTRHLVEWAAVVTATPPER